MTVTSCTVALPPVSTGSNAPERTSAIRGALVQPTSTSTVSPSAGRLATSWPPSMLKSVTSQLRPASSRADSPAATSAERTEAAKRTFSAPEAATTASSASTRGCGNGAAKAGASTTYTFGAPKAPAAAATSRDSVADDDPRDVTAEGECPRKDAQRALLDRAVVVLEEDEGAHRSFLAASQSTSCLRGRAVVLDLDLVALRGRRCEREHRRPRAGGTGPARFDADVRERQRLGRLGLGAHDSLQRRVARLVDRVGDRHDRGQRRGDDVVAELRLAFPGHGRRRRSRGRRPERPSDAAGGRRRRPRARRRRSQTTAGRRARDRHSSRSSVFAST